MGCRLSSPEVLYHYDRDIGSNKACCGAFCLLEGDEYCCVHIQHARINRYCHYCQGRYDYPPSTVSRRNQRTNRAYPSQRSSSPGSRLESLSRGTTIAGVDANTSRTTSNNRWVPFPSTSAIPISERSCNFEAISSRLQSVADPKVKASIERCRAAMECPICLDAYSRIVCVLPCGHTFCQFHIVQLHNCPLCRMPLSVQDRRSLRPSLAVREMLGSLKNAIDTMLEMDDKKGMSTLETESTFASTKG